MHEYGRGWSLTHRRDRPFLGTREGVIESREDQYRQEGDSCISNAGIGSKLSKTTTAEDESGNAPAVSTQVSAVYYITNFPNRLMYKFKESDGEGAS